MAKVAQAGGGGVKPAINKSPSTNLNQSLSKGKYVNSGTPASTGATKKPVKAKSQSSSFGMAGSSASAARANKQKSGPVSAAAAAPRWYGGK